MYLLLRFAKLLAVAMLFAGSLGALLPRALADRRLFAYAVAGPGFILTWFFGFWLWRELAVPVTATWILASLGLSLFSLQAVLFAVGRDGRRTWTVALVVMLPLLAAFALMVFKPA